MQFLTQPIPDQALIDKLKDRALFPSPMNAEQWEQVALSIREASFFSARVESARALAIMQNFLQAFLENARVTLPSGEEMLKSGSRADFVKQLQDELRSIGYTSPETGRNSMIDLLSESRLALIWNMGTGMAQGYAWWQQGNAPEILDAFPAQELIRDEQRLIPRNWRERWAEAGGKFYNGRPIARKDDGIWTRISRFGVPWPPYDYNSGMGVRDIERDEAEALGLIDPDEVMQPPQAGYLDGINATVKGLPQVLVDALKESLGSMGDNISASSPLYASIPRKSQD